MNLVNTTVWDNIHQIIPLSEQQSQDFTAEYKNDENINRYNDASAPILKSTEDMSCHVQRF